MHTLLAGWSNGPKAFASRHEPAFQCSTDMVSFGQVRRISPPRDAVPTGWSAALATADAIYTHGSPIPQFDRPPHLQCHLCPRDQASFKACWCLDGIDRFLR